MQEPLNSLVTRNPSPPALPLGLFPQQPPRNGPQALPTFRIGPWVPTVVPLPAQDRAGAALSPEVAVG